MTDISPRALRLAATVAALNGLSWQLRRGSLLDPVAQDRFDLVVSNPPFVVSPGYRTGSGGFDYRDSGLAGDGVCRALVRGLPRVLTDGGTAQLLANWVIDRDTPWDEGVRRWFVGRPPVTAWAWQREVAEPGEYVAMWLRDAGLDPQTPDYRRRYDEWLSWFGANEVAGIGMGVISMRRTDGATDLVCEDVPQPMPPGAGAEVDDWFARRAWLTSTSDETLVRSRLRAANGLVLSTHSELSDGWQRRLQMVRQSSGLRWEVEVDDAMTRLLAGCDGSVDLAVPISLLAADLGVSDADLRQAALPVVRDMVGRGLLQPVLEPA